jgi:HK97 family phage prohead protease
VTDTLTDAPPADLCVREFQVREVAADAREFTGIAVPWGQVAEIGGVYREIFERGAVQDSDAARLFWRHREPIGRITAARDTDAGWEITAALSDTTQGRDAYALLRDGAIDQLSIGFEPVEHREEVQPDGSVTVTRTRVRVREVSLVPFPAYDGAAVTQVRHATPAPPTKESPVTTTTDAPDVDQLRSDVDEIRRTFAEIVNQHRNSEPQVHYRSAGHLLKALAAGEERAIKEYNDTLQRAWDPAGAVVADGTRPGAGWVGDLTRIVDEAAVLASLFSDGALPSEGMTIEYAELASNTVQVGKQETEGDDLPFGKVSSTVKNAQIATYGGYSRLSLQAIQRSSVNLLNHTLTALGIAAGKRRNTVYRSVFAAAVAAQRAANNTVTVADSTDYADWLDAIIDAAEKYTDLGLALDALVVDKSVFKSLARLEGSDGRPLLTISGSGTNVVGDLNVTAIQGNLASVPVRLNPKQVLPGASFINRLAIREYRSPLARLQDENVVNLSQDFSVYFYAAHAVEIPAAIVPVQITA